jgi:serine phosphatase RsbU (regulator of sigma subunit)
MRFTDDSFRPGSGREMSTAAAKHLGSAPGWFIGSLGDEGASMIGYSPVHLLGIYTSEGDISGPAFHMVVHQPAEAVLATLRQRTLVLAAAGSAAILLCAASGIFFIRRNVLRPIETLRRAAAAVASTANHAHSGSFVQGRQGVILRELGTIRTGDEMEDLARDFSTMADRLLDYQTDLKREIAEKTAEIQRDLDMARDFQQAFLPRDYPTMPAGDHEGGLTLSFHHIYNAASTVSGDFFDVLPLGDRRVGVLIADVMGHGTRSALVTAILRTILHSLGSSAGDPARFLSLLNWHFFDTMKKADQLIFVSACYVVIDTATNVISYASAGHPSPLIGNRKSALVEPLFPSLKDNPALGLFPVANYESFTRPLRAEDTLLLFTDGIVEAMNPKDEDFGRERLEHALADHLNRDASGVAQAVLQRMLEFVDGEPPSDDVCLVAIQAVPVRTGEALPSEKIDRKLHEE